jgi:signal transduction histidine kinase
VDRHAIAQVFRNVLENAIVACREPGEIVIRVGESVLNGAPAVSISFRDNGPGLNAEQRNRIFDPFYTTKTQGTGLGMAIAKRIVDSHGGRIEVGSPPGGAEIVIVLPR